MIKINLNVKEDIYRKFQEICRENGTSVAVEIRRFMLLEVEKKEAKDNK